ncbi:unnamed protein product [Rotaria sordida]|uniref:Uncharacterized protein n=2 Tax=Rotaria sordida TaxID=392033 RepID=A0A814S564_9BILA|nr:unnamed protein product [Rotaria sordida]CAF1141516.1 unnamed protein product [Rotaria sordida]CAF3642959.1 unnamed protein product [Rotaria sordida]
MRLLSVLFALMMPKNIKDLYSHEKDNYHNIERLLDRKSPLFRFPHDQLDNEQTRSQYMFNICEILNENFEKIRLRLNVKALDEYYNIPKSYSQLYTQRQQQQFAQSTETLNIKSTNDDRAFTDLNLRGSKRSLHSIIQTFKIDCSLVNRIELNWPILFTHIIARLKPSIIYHLVTLRFEFQTNSSSSLTDAERLAVGKLIQLLTSFSNEKQ